jgi:uncharacterized membrane protein HdeD (DUF308 family)
MAWIDEAKKNSTTLVVLGVLTVIFGMLAIGMPFISGIAVTLYVGFLMLAMGVMQIIAAFKSGQWGAGILGALIGVLSILAGLFMVGRPVAGMAALALVLAAYFVVDGISEILISFRMRPETGWGWMFFNGAIAALLGFLLWRQWPYSGAFAIGLLFGIHILFSGFTMIFVGSSTRRFAGMVEDAVDEVVETADEATAKVGAMAAGAVAAAKDAAEDMGEAAGDMAHKAKEMAEDAVDAAKDVAEDVGEAAGDAVDKAKEIAGDAVDKAKDLVDGDEDEEEKA